MRGSETVTVKPQVKVDRLRNPSGTAPEPYDIKGCFIWPRASLEEGKGWVTVEGLQVFAPAGSVVPASARVNARGEDYEVDGVPGDYRMHGRQRGILITLKRVGSS